MQTMARPVVMAARSETGHTSVDIESEINLLRISQVDRIDVMLQTVIANELKY